MWTCYSISSSGLHHYPSPEVIVALVERSRPCPLEITGNDSLHESTWLPELVIANIDHILLLNRLCLTDSGPQEVYRLAAPNLETLCITTRRYLATLPGSPRQDRAHIRTEPLASGGAL